MTEQDKIFITALIDGVKLELKSMKELFEKDLDGIKDNFKVKLESIHSNQTKFREDIIDIYDKYRNLVDRFARADNKIIMLETELGNHKENHAEGNEGKRANASLVAAIVFGVVMAGLAVVGFIV